MNSETILFPSNTSKDLKIMHLLLLQNVENDEKLFY